MLTVSNITKPSNDAIMACMPKQAPEWFDSIGGAVECLSLDEAKDVLSFLIPNASIMYQRGNSIIAKANNIQYQITALNMKHFWSEDHCTDKILVKAVKSGQQTITVVFTLSDISSIHQIAEAFE